MANQVESTCLQCAERIWIRQVRRRPLMYVNLDGSTHRCQVRNTTHTKNRDVLPPPPGSDPIRVKDRWPEWRQKKLAKGRPSAWRELDRDEP